MHKGRGHTGYESEGRCLRVLRHFLLILWSGSEIASDSDPSAALRCSTQPSWQDAALALPAPLSPDCEKTIPIYSRLIITPLAVEKIVAHTSVN